MHIILKVSRSILFIFAVSTCLVATNSAQAASDPSSDFTPVFKGSPWAHIDNTNDWTSAVISVLQKRLGDLEKAQDVGDFCPEYRDQSTVSKYVCWIRIIGGIVKFESDFRYDDVYPEPGGGVSIGLLSLSPGQCSDAPNKKDLRNPVKNLNCGINLMADLVARDGYIDSPDSRHGISYNWSTIRKPYKDYGKNLGFKYDIIEISKKYRTF